MSEEEFESNFLEARASFLEEYGQDSDIEISVSYSDIARWQP